MKFVLAIHRGGTLSHAAEQLNVDQTTVTRRLKLLEQNLKVALFDRLNNKLIVTQAGEVLLETAEKTETLVLSSIEKVHGTDVKCCGKVRITAVPLLMNQFIAKRMGCLLKQHPALAIELSATAQNLAFSKRQTDIALRFERPRSTMAVCRKVCTLSYSVYFKKGQGKDELPFIGFADERQNLPQALWLDKQKQLKQSVQLMVDDADSAFAALLAGEGRGLFPDLVMDDQPKVSKDVRFSNVLQRELWMLIHPDMRKLKRIRVVGEYLYNLLN